MFTENVNDSTVAVKRRGPGRPPGSTRQGLETRKRLYDTAIKLMTERGYENTTLRAVADAAGVSVGLLYRYFPSKRSVVLALYDELSAEYALRSTKMGPGKWRDRFLFALTTSLEVLAPHRQTLSALVPVLIGDPDDGLFAPRTELALPDGGSTSGRALTSSCHSRIPPVNPSVFGTLVTSCGSAKVISLALPPPI